MVTTSMSGWKPITGWIFSTSASPQLPCVAGSYSPDTTGINYVSGVAVKNGYAYITEYHNGVRVIDVSNPAKPYEVMNKMGINANDIKILGRLCVCLGEIPGI